VCSRATAQAGPQEGRPQLTPRPWQYRRLLPRDNAGAGALRPQCGSSNLSDQILALASGKTQQEIAAACKGARPNHVGAAIARHKRAGRIEERDGKLYATQSAGTKHGTAV